MSKYAPSNDLEHELVGLIQTALRAISFDREAYDALALYTTARRGQGFLKLIREPLRPESLSRILGGLASFIREVTLVKESRTDSEQAVLDYMLGIERGKHGDWFGYDIDYVRNVLPGQLINTQHMALGQLRADVLKARSDFVSEVGELEGRINGHRDELKKLESGFNFVGLSHAFRQLLKTKAGERRRSFALTTFLGFAAVVIPFYVVFVWNTSLAEAVISTWSPVSVSRLVAALGAEVVVLYYFRIALRSYLLVQNQATNLELRVALCSFIEGYLDFADKAAKSNGTIAIAGFETLIFSALPASDERLPATLDGIEHIAKIVGGMKRG